MAIGLWIYATISISCIPYVIQKHRRCTHEQMPAFYYRKYLGRNEYDLDSKSWLEQAIDNPV